MFVEKNDMAAIPRTRIPHLRCYNSSNCALPVRTWFPCPHSTGIAKPINKVGRHIFYDAPTHTNHQIKQVPELS